MEKYKVEVAVGIIMNPKIGEILEMSSISTFELSNYQSYSVETINRNEK